MLKMIIEIEEVIMYTSYRNKISAKLSRTCKFLSASWGCLSLVFLL